MKTLRKFPSWLPRKLEGLVFSLFALVWTASLGGCQTTEPSDKVIAKYGGPPVHDTLVAKYGAPAPSDSTVAKYGTPQPKDSVVAKYGIPQPEPIQVRYGTFMPVDTVIAKYGVPTAPDTAKTTFAPGKSGADKAADA